MPGAFTINASAPTIRLDSSGWGNVVFTVANALDRPVQARADLRVSGDTRREWLRVEGDVTRAIPAGASATFTVGIQVPPEVRSGVYRFSVNVVDVTAASGACEEGPEVRFEVAATVDAERRRRWSAGVALGLVAFLAVTSFAACKRNGGTGGAGDTPVIGQPCPESGCAEGLVCAPEQICLGAPGFEGCTRNLDCITGRCEQGTCAGCAQGLTLCGARCVSLTTDAAHCGACGNVCEENQDCQNSRCVLARCPTGRTLCRGSCEDLQEDPRNCGQCGRTCSAFEDCRNGQCVLSSCPPGQKLCGNACRDVQVDPRNCGRCGQVCSSQHACRDGRCVRTSCPSGLALCGEFCRDLDRDERNCGRCGRICPEGQECDDGRCRRCQFPERFCECTRTCMSLIECTRVCRVR